LPTIYIWKKMALVKQKLDQIKTNGKNKGWEKLVMW
jgi:hypothetical protein